MFGTLDRYLFRGIALRTVTVAAIIVLLLQMENAARLVADVQRTDQPLRLLGSLSLLLMPEHLGVALPMVLSEQLHGAQ